MAQTLMGSTPVPTPHRLLNRCTTTMLILVKPLQGMLSQPPVSQCVNPDQVILVFVDL